jgi:hypothetical protein
MAYFHEGNSSAPQPQRPQPKIGIKDTTEVVCDKCQHNVFNMGLYLRKVSPLLSGTGKPSYLPIDNVAFHCVKCGHVNDEFVPAELKTNKLVP